MRCFVVAGFLLTSAACGPSAIAELLVSTLLIEISSMYCIIHRAVLPVKLAGHIGTPGVQSLQWRCSFTATVSRLISGRCTARTRYTPVERSSAWKSCERWTGRARDENVIDWKSSTVRWEPTSCMCNDISARHTRTCKNCSHVTTRAQTARHDNQSVVASGANSPFYSWYYNYSCYSRSRTINCRMDC